MLLQEELTLVAQAKTGEKAALSNLWDAITPKLYGYLVNVTREPNLAEDILQETWFRAISGLSKFQPRGVRFSAWLFAIARNECRQHWRKGNREVSVDGIEENEKNIIKPREMLEQHILLEDILKKLPGEDQELLRLRYIGEFSHKEIAKILTISIIAARVRIHRALGRARVILENK